MNHMNNNAWGKRWFLFIPLIILGCFGFGWLVQFLWNSLIPDIFHLSPISYWQAVGLFVLSRIFFGGSGMKGKGWKYRNADPAMKEKFMNMTDEEKQAFKDQWRKRCC